MAGLIVFVAAFAAHAVTASPALGWLDSPELVAASAELGVPHSPGHPATVLVGRLASLIPIGDLALRVNLASALMTAAAATCVWAAGRRVVRAVDPDGSERLASAAAATAALAFAFCEASWAQATRAEVYALEALLVAATLTAVLAFVDGGSKRALYAGALLAGLALSNHHFIALGVLAPATVAVYARKRSRRPGSRPSAIAAMLGILGLAAFLYLPVRATTDPEPNWGAPDTAERFAWTVSAVAFQRSASTEHVSTPAEDAVEVTAALVEQTTPLLFLLALIGLVAGARRQRFRRAALVLAAVVVLGAAGRVLVGYDPGTPDHLAYLQPAVLALLLLALAGLALFAGALRRAGLPRSAAGSLPVAVLAIVAGWQLTTTGPQRARADAVATDAIARWELDALPPNTVLLPGYFQTSFRLWGARALWGARPDVAILDRSFLTYPGAAGSARARHPELTAIIDAPLRAGSPTPVDSLRHLAGRRPVRVQLHPNLDPGVRPWLMPAGPFAILPADPPTEAERRRTERLDARGRAQLARILARAGDRTAARDTLLWHDFVRLQQYCATERLEAARTTLDSAWALAPGDGMLVELASRCGLGIPEPR